MVTPSRAFFDRTFDSLLAPNREEDLTPLIEEALRLARLKPRGFRVELRMAHLRKQADSSGEGVHWKCSECGWASAPMYFGEVFEPEHLCPSEYCGCGHRRLEHKHDVCAGAKIREDAGDIRQTQELCGCKSFIAAGK
jgi:hypothetical protein